MNIIERLGQCFPNFSPILRILWISNPRLRKLKDFKNFFWKFSMWIIKKARGNSQTHIEKWERLLKSFCFSEKFGENHIKPIFYLLLLNKIQITKITSQITKIRNNYLVWEALLYTPILPFWNFSKSHLKHTFFLKNMLWTVWQKSKKICGNFF